MKKHTISQVGSQTLADPATGLRPGAESVPLEFNHWRYSKTYEGRMSFSASNKARSKAWSDFAGGQGFAKDIFAPRGLQFVPDWQFRVDLTYRVGSADCERQGEVTHSEGCRHIDQFAKELYDNFALEGGRVDVVACAEPHASGKLHWHCLVSFSWGTKTPHITKADIDSIWQVWRRWPAERQSYGVQGHTWLIYLKRRGGKKAAKYAAKYAVKRPDLVHVASVGVM